MDLKLDTICALATGSGIGAIAVVRISGPNSRRILSKCFSKDLSKAETHTIHFGTISSNDGAQIDEVLVSYFEHGRSFTGEESIEVSCHGSPYVNRFWPYYSIVVVEWLNQESLQSALLSMVSSIFLKRKLWQI